MLKRPVKPAPGKEFAQEEPKRDEADARLARAIEAWNEFDERVGSLSAEHSTL